MRIYWQGDRKCTTPFLPVLCRQQKMTARNNGGESLLVWNLHMRHFPKIVIMSRPKMGNARGLYDRPLWACKGSLYEGKAAPGWLKTSRQRFILLMAWPWLLILGQVVEVIIIVQIFGRLIISEILTCEGKSIRPFAPSYRQCVETVRPMQIVCEYLIAMQPCCYGTEMSSCRWVRLIQAMTTMIFTIKRVKGGENCRICQDDLYAETKSINLCADHAWWKSSCCPTESYSGKYTADYYIK